LQDAHNACVNSNGSMQAFVVSLLSSNSCVYRAKSEQSLADAE